MSGPADIVAPSAGADTGSVLNGYLTNFSARLRVSGVYFEDPEADALVSVVHAEVGNRMRGARERTAAAERLARQAARGISAGGVAANAAGYALSVGAAGQLGGDIPTELIMRALQAGETSGEGSALWCLGWRVRFLSAARHLVEEEQVEACADWLRMDADRISRRCVALFEDPSDIGLCARLAWFAAAPGAGGGSWEAARGLVDSLLARHQGGAVPGPDGECTAPVRTVELMRLALAARATQHRHEADAITGWVLANRDGGPNALLRRDSVNASRLESSPWVALSLAWTPEQSAPSRQPSPIAPGPFEIEAVDVGPGTISYALSVEAIRTTHTVDYRHLNLLCGTALNAASREALHPPRRAAQLLSALIALRSCGGDSYTNASIDRLIAQAIDRLLAGQLPSGDWPPRHRIDVTACGVALCKAFLHSRDDRCSAAALRAADWLGQADAPPANSTEALWQASFYAHLARVCSGVAATRASKRCHDLLRDVRQDTRQTTWGRWLLAEIEPVAGGEAAALSASADAEADPDGALSLGDQLRLVAAARGSRHDRRAGLRAFGQAVIGHWDESSASLAVRPSQLPWLIGALAGVAGLEELGYRVSLDDVRTADERILLALRRLWDGQQARERAQGNLRGEMLTALLADRASGCAALYRRTRDADWHAEGMSASQLLMAGQHPDGFWPAADGMPSLDDTAAAGLALLQTAEITRHERLPEAAQRAAAWLSGAMAAMCNRARQGEAVPLASLGRAAVLLARGADPSPEASEAAAVCVSTLLGAQDERGLWGEFAGGRPGEVGIDVLGRVSDLAWTRLESAELDRALRIGIDSMWQSFFTPQGQGYADPEREADMSAQWSVVYAAACCDGAARFADTSLLRRATSVLRHTMSTHRTADGDLRPLLGTLPEARCSARYFLELANIFERAPDVAEL